jgi:hypothetical protein
MTKRKGPRLTRTRAKYQVGMKGNLFCRSGVKPCIINDVGGTTQLPSKTYRVEVVKINPGQRLVVKLLDPEDVKLAKETGTTGHKPEDYKQYEAVNPSLYTRAVEAKKNFRPDLIYCVGFEFTPQE